METVFLDVDDRIMMCTTNKLESICQLSQLRGSLFACKLVLLHTIMCTIIIQKQKKNIIEGSGKVSRVSHRGSSLRTTTREIVMRGDVLMGNGSARPDRS